MDGAAERVSDAELHDSRDELGGTTIENGQAED